MKKVYIVGAGISALHLGIRLQHAGYDVTLFEKNPFAGGVVHRAQYGDYTFDATASIMISPEAYAKVFKDCNRNPRDYYTNFPLSETFRMFPRDESSFTFPSDITTLSQKIRNDFPRSVKGYFRFLHQTRMRYSLAQKQILRRRLKGPVALVSPSLLYHTYRLHTFSSAASYLNRYIPDRLLKDSLLFQTLFMGYDPYRIPNIYTAIPAVVQIDGLHHIQGGLSAYSVALVQLFTELGGQLKLNTPVQEILFEKACAIGLKIKHKVYKADAIVVATDYRYAYTKLLPASIRSQVMCPTRFKTLTSSTGVMILRLVIDQELSHLGLHNLLLPYSFKVAMSQTFGGIIPDDPPIYVYYPAAVDPTFKTREGHVCFHAMIRVPHLGDLDTTDDTCFDTLRTVILERLEQVTGITHLSQHVVFEHMVTPYDFWKDYNYTEGCAFGLAHTFTQSMALRPQATCPGIDNLYFVGTNIHPGNGLSIVMDSAKLAADLMTELL